MPDVLENARRWGGFVCPDCRFVFRVPRDHDGKGVVCPCCKRLLRIPIAGETTVPLVVPVRQAEPEADPQEHEPRKKKRRSKRSGSQETEAWERPSHARHSGRREKRQMLWMLVGGAALFALILAGVITVALNRGGNSTTAAAPPPSPPAVAKSPAEADARPEVMRNGEAAFLLEAEELARKFLSVRSVDEMLPLVRDPENAEPRMRRFYPDGFIAPAGLASFNESGYVGYRDRLASVILRTADYQTRSLAYVGTPGGLKIDWESWVGWSEMPWDEFVVTKPATPVVFRVNVKPVDYYNFEFKDDVKWQAYSLASPDGGHTLYGYAERGSGIDKRLRPDEAGGVATVTLALKYPAGAASERQVLIDRFITDGWVEGLPDTP